MSRIIIADDSVLMRNNLKQILKMIGIEEVITFEHGKHLIEHYKECFKNGIPINLIILDTTMPIMSGFDTLEEILRINPNAQIIMFTELDQRVVVKGIKLGAKQCIAKPLNKEQVKRVVMKFI